MNDRNRRSAAEVMANAARVVKAAVNIVRAAIAGGLHGAAATAAKELLPTIIKFAIGVLIAIIVIPMFVISAMPNMFFGYETSEKDPQITMREQALSIGGAEARCGKGGKEAVCSADRQNPGIHSVASRSA